MLKDLFGYVMTSPYTFLSGLVLASELLPLPLPIQAREPLTEAQTQMTLNQRKLWGAHLLPLTSEIGDILRNLSGSSCQPLQQLLRRVCWQLADLSAPTALLVVRCLIDTVFDGMDTAVAEQSLDTIRVSPLSFVLCIGISTLPKFNILTVYLICKLPYYLFVAEISKHLTTV